MTEAPTPRWTTMRPFAVVSLAAGLLVWPLLLVGAVATSRHEGGGVGALGAAGFIAGFMCSLIALMLAVFALFTDDPRIKLLAQLATLVVVLDIVTFLGVAVLVLANASWS